jgi:sugar/nucleoside kinase (ribokinase family)
VVVVGDANPDLLLTGDVVPRFGQVEQLLDSADLVLGGSAAIVAAGLARLGVATALVAAVGDDTFGWLTRDLLEDAGVDTRWLRVDGTAPTGLSVILSSQGRAILTHPGTIATTGPGVLPPASELGGVRHVHSASVFLQPHLAPALPGFLSAARAQGATTSVDTNWDPAENWVAAHDLLQHADLFLPNAAELAAVTGQADRDAAAAWCAVRGITLVLKDGGAGGTVWAPDGTSVSAPGIAVEVVDTTGAGDSFDAGFLSGWIASLPLAEALARATAAGSLSTRGVGGTGAQPTLDELEAALRP